MKFSAIALAATLGAAGVGAQSPSPAFEVASIKRNTTGSLNANASRVAGQEQLRLRLQAGRGPVEMLIVDRAERPVPD
jgi:hypothetical protein